MLLEIISILVLFILPVVLIYFKIIPFKYKVHTLAVITSLITIIILVRGWGAETLGLHLNLVRSYLIPYLVFTVGVGGVLLLISKIEKRSGAKQWWKDPHFLYGFILVSLLQEFIFRGFLIPELQSIFALTILVILINALLFGFIHIIYSDDIKALVMIFLGGVAFASMYVYFPSLILIAISHTILNFIAVYYGFFTEEKSL